MPEPDVPPVELRPAGWRRWAGLLPTLTFLIGLALGAALTGITTSDPTAPPSAAAAPTVAAPTVAPAGQPSPTGLVVRVPQPCLQAAEDAAVAYDVLDQAVTAARNLDAQRLQQLVDQVQDQQNRTRALVLACRQQNAQAATGPAPTPAG